MRQPVNGDPGGGRRVFSLSNYKICDIAYVRAACERWARWNAVQGVGMASTLGKMLSGMKSTRCPRCLGRNPACGVCDGTGQVSARLRSETKSPFRLCPMCNGYRQPGGDEHAPTRFAGDVCFRCLGQGLVRQVDIKVNPALIRDTTHVGGRWVNDYVAAAVDDLWCLWRQWDETVWLNRVLKWEYFYNGTQTTKAKEMRISESFYKKRLHDAHGAIEIMLNSIDRECLT